MSTDTWRRDDFTKERKQSSLRLLKLNSSLRKLRACSRVHARRDPLFSTQGDIVIIFMIVALLQFPHEVMSPNQNPPH